MLASFTRADYDRLPEGFPAQLVEGMLVKEPARTYGHQNILGRLHAALLQKVPHDLVVLAPTDVVVDDLNVYQPDVVVLRRVPPLTAHDVGIPRVAFEVLSPSTAERDRHRKLPRLLAAGTEEVWLVDRESGSIEVWSADGMARATGDTPAASRAIPGFAITPAALFEPPRGA